MRIWPFSKAESHTLLGKELFVFLFSIVVPLELIVYLFFSPQTILYGVVVLVIDFAIYVVGNFFVFQFIDIPLITLMNRVRHTSLTLKPAKRVGLKGELDEILKEVDRLAETLSRERGGLLETYNEYRSIVESLEEGIVMTKDDGEILMMNGGAEKIFSTHRSEWKSKKINDFFRFYGIIFDKAKKIVSVKRVEKRLVIREITMDLRNKFATLYIFEDVTEISNLENALSRAENLALLGKMTASVAHEIKTPIASLKLSVQLLKRQISTNDPELSETLDVLDKEVRRLEERSKGFLEFSNPHYDLKPINVVDVVTESIKLARIRARDKNVKIDFQCPQQSIPILGDTNALNSAFLNILVNGMDACEENDGKIIVNVERDSKSVGITFSDNGIGIAPDDVDYIFEPFFTLKNGGTGLGMSIVKRVITSHSGKIEVRSKQKMGTVVKIRIPIFGDENG